MRARRIGTRAKRDRVFGIFPRLHERRSQLAGSLSGGEQQMLAIGRALMAEPRLLLVDELSLGLMPKMVDLCLDALDAIEARRPDHRAGRAEHRARARCRRSRSACCRRASQVYQGTAAEAKAAGSMFATFLGMSEPVAQRSNQGRRWRLQGRSTMTRMLTADDLEAGLVGGLFLSAGGSGRNAVDKNRGLGQHGARLWRRASGRLDELDPDAAVITATAVGAPGFANWAIKPRDAVNAARRLIERLDKPPVGVICGHVPGFNAWLVAAALGLDYVDAAANGRGHPTVKMGGMGLASRPDLSITQVASSGSKREKSMNSPSVAEGDIVRTSNVMRQAAMINGGLIYAARGPLTAGFIRENGAPGAITFQLDLGRAMLAADGADRIARDGRISRRRTAGRRRSHGEHRGLWRRLRSRPDDRARRERRSRARRLQRIHDRRYRRQARGDISRHDRNARSGDRRGGLDLGIARPAAASPSSSRIARNFRSARARSIPRCFPRSRRPWASICAPISEERPNHHAASLRQPLVRQCLEGAHPAHPARYSLRTRHARSRRRARRPSRRSAPRAASPAFPCSNWRTAAPSSNSAAIMLYLAEGSPFLPDDRYLRAEVTSWLTFEQADLLRALALPRFYHMRGIADQMASRIADFQEGAYLALAKLDDWLATHDWLVDDRYTIADIGVFGYVAMAPQGGYDMSQISVDRRLARAGQGPARLGSAGGGGLSMTIPVRRGKEVKAGRGTTLRCKGWRQEAILRLLENNLENGEDPDNLVIYMSIARAARDWKSFDRIVADADDDARGSDARHAVGQADRRVSRANDDAARHHGQRQYRRRMERRGKPPQARRHGADRSCPA